LKNIFINQKYPSMLKYKADLRTLAYLVVTTALLFVQWNLESFNFWIFVFSLFMAVSVAVIAHNHNHLPIWQNDTLNKLTDYWLTLFYGFPAFGWIPTHNRNHHRFNNREGDYTITYRLTEKNHLGVLLTRLLAAITNRRRFKITSNSSGKKTAAGFGFVYHSTWFLVP
jgi:fatty acid desaturase